MIGQSFTSEFELETSVPHAQIAWEARDRFEDILGSLDGDDDQEYGDEEEHDDEDEDDDDEDDEEYEDDDDYEEEDDEDEDE